MSMPKKPSKLNDKFVLKKGRRNIVQSFADTEDGVRSFVQSRTAYDADGIDTITREEDGDGVWRVTFKGRRILRVFVGTNPRAPDFDIERN